MQTSTIIRPFLDIDITTTSEELFFTTDTSKNPLLGFGCFFDCRWAFGQWEPEYIAKNDPSITYLELFVLCMGIFIWQSSPKLKNSRIVIFCNNESVVHMVNNLSSSCKNCMYLIRLLTLNKLLYNRIVSVKYISTRNNYLSDLLSRQKLADFLAVAPANVRNRPDTLSTQLWPASKIWQK